MKLKLFFFLLLIPVSFLTHSTPSFSPSNTTCCPICEIPLEEENIEKHFNYELGKFIGVDKRRKEEQSNGLYVYYFNI